MLVYLWVNAIDRSVSLGLVQCRQLNFGWIYFYACANRFLFNSYRMQQMLHSAMSQISKTLSFKIYHDY